MKFTFDEPDLHICEAMINLYNEERTQVYTTFRCELGRGHNGNHIKRMIENSHYIEIRWELQ